jgi:hypothetical protein
MTQIKYYRFLYEHWRGRRDALADELADTQTEMMKWRMMLASAEQIALDSRSKA